MAEFKQQREMPSMLEEDHIIEYLSEMDINRLAGPGEIQPRELERNSVTQ